VVPDNRHYNFYEQWAQGVVERLADVVPWKNTIFWHPRFTVHMLDDDRAPEAPISPFRQLRIFGLSRLVRLSCYGAGEPRHDPSRIPRALGVNVEKSPPLQLDASCYCSAPD
jgi:hypothetical protein